MLNRNELILEGLAYTVMGILIVFMILVIIMLVIKAMALLNGEGRKKTVEPTQQIADTIPQEAPDNNDDTELIAVITAAIAVAIEQNTTDFVVRSYKKVSGGAWNKAGRRDVLENRF